MPRRIALVTSSFHPHFGGVEQHVRQVARDLLARGNSVAVWTVDRGERIGVATVDGIGVRYLPAPLPARSLSAARAFAMTSPSAARAWWRAYRADRPDVLHVQCFGPNGTYALALGRLTRTPLVVSSHGETFMDDHAVFDVSWLQRRALGLALQQADAVTACSPTVETDLRSRYRFGPVTVVPNAVRLPAAMPAPAPAGAPLLAVGRVERVKGFDYLLAALADPRFPADRRLVVVGDGSARAGLQARSAALGLAERVDFLGAQDEAAVARHMQRAAAVLVPSRREAFGMVVIEAWAAGTPVVVTDRGGPADLVQDGVTGRVVDPSDPGAIVAAVQDVLRPERAARLAAAGWAAVQDYTWQNVAAQYERLYRQVLEPR